MRLASRHLMFLSQVFIVSHVLADQPIAHTDSGTVAGIRLTQSRRNVSVYFGIPFAEPPVGRRRFLKPEPIAPWPGVLNATAMSPGCVQTNFYIMKGTLVNMSDTSEDCLYINMWVPQQQDCSTTSEACGDLMPVFVFVYGGAFQWGSSAFAINDGSEFAARTGTVYVTFNYRVGVLGFLNASCPEAPGNMGLYDQLEALRWIKRNVRHFGGDPERITLAGHSAGAASVCYHMVSPLSKGLFQRVVLLSGSLHMVRYGESTNHAQILRLLSAYLNCSDPNKWSNAEIDVTVDCLRTVDAHALAEAARASLSYRFIKSIPNYGDEILPTNPYDMGHQDLHVKEILLGTTENDGEFLAFHTCQHLPCGGLGLDAQSVFFGALTLIMSLGAEEARRITKGYFGTDDLHEAENAAARLSQAMTDMSFECPMDLFASEALKKGVSLYRYLFSYRPSISPWDNWVVATHNDDLAYFLGSAHARRSNLNHSHDDVVKSLLLNSVPTADDLQLSSDLVDVLGKFVRTGRPKIPQTNKDWPRYTNEDKAYVILKPNDYRVAQGPRSTKCNLWEANRERKTTTPPKTVPLPTRRFADWPMPQAPAESNTAVAIQPLHLSSIFSFLMAAALSSRGL